MSNDQDKHHEHSGGKFFNGLLFGALIGAGAFYLLGTEKGKKILKTVTELGLDGITEVDDMVDEEMDGEMEEEELTKPGKKINTEGPEIIETIEAIETVAPKKPTPLHHVKRIFKNISKKKA